VPEKKPENESEKNGSDQESDPWDWDGEFLGFAYRRLPEQQEVAPAERGSYEVLDHGIPKSQRY
jgi:hypothetical protein